MSFLPFFITYVKHHPYTTLIKKKKKNIKSISKNIRFLSGECQLITGKYFTSLKIIFINICACTDALNILLMMMAILVLVIILKIMKNSGKQKMSK